MSRWAIPAVAVMLLAYGAVSGRLRSTPVVVGDGGRQRWSGRPPATGQACRRSPKTGEDDQRSSGPAELLKAPVAGPTRTARSPSACRATKHRRPKGPPQMMTQEEFMDVVALRRQG